MWYGLEGSAGWARLLCIYVCAAGIRIGGLEAFEDGGFDLKSDLSSLTEKGIDVLRTDLAALDIECAEELRKSVHANYIPFITASQVISLCKLRLCLLECMLHKSLSNASCMNTAHACPSQSTPYHERAACCASML